jgi:hypothetical protein
LAFIQSMEVAGQIWGLTDLTSSLRAMFDWHMTWI